VKVDVNKRFFMSELSSFTKVDNVDLKMEPNDTTLLMSEEFAHSIKELNIDGIRKKLDLSILNKCSQLKSLTLRGIYGITDLSFINKCTNLVKLDIDASELRDISSLKNLPSLTSLSLNDCGVLTSLTQLPHLIELVLRDCISLDNMSGLEELPILEF
jgi:hypothetical protein